MEKEKEYNDKGNLILEGKYLNCKRLNRKEKEYFDNDKLKFEGEYYN